MLLFIIDKYKNITEFSFFTRPSEKEFQWTINVIRTCRFVKTHAQEMVMTIEGSLAMALGTRYGLCAQSTRFLLDVWQSSFATDSIKEYACILVSFFETPTDNIFKKDFEYSYCFNGKNEEEIPCPTTMESLPASICKINVYRCWSRLHSSERKRWCERNFIHNGGMEEIERIVKDLNRFLMGKGLGGAGLSRWVYNSEIWGPQFDEVNNPRGFSHNLGFTGGGGSWRGNGRNNNSIVTVSFILEYLCASFFTNIALVHSDQTTVSLIIDDLRVEGAIDWDRERRFEHKGELRLVLFTSVKSSHNDISISNLNPIPWMLPPQSKILLIFVF